MAVHRQCCSIACLGVRVTSAFVLVLRVVGVSRQIPLAGGGHLAMGDCQATLAVLREIAEAEEMNACEQCS